MARKPKQNAAAATLLTMRGDAPAENDVHDELTIFWDGFSPLSLNAVRLAVAADKSLDDIGTIGSAAETFVNKYNSIILRAPGRGPLVRASEAAAWHGAPMRTIIDEVTTRAQP